MQEDLTQVNIWSALFVLILFTAICCVSVNREKKKIFARIVKTEKLIYNKIEKPRYKDLASCIGVFLPHYSAS